MKMKEENEKVGLKFNIQKTKIMTSVPITSWQIDGETMETVKEFIFFGSKITVNGELAPWKKSYDKRRYHIKIRDISFLTKVRLAKTMVFPVVMYGCDSWTIKKAEGQRINAFELWCWRRLLTVPWTAKKSSQSVLKEINPKYSLEGLMLKLKLQYFSHLLQRTDSLEKTLILENIECRKRRGQKRMRWLDGITIQLDGHEFE